MKLIAIVFLAAALAAIGSLGLVYSGLYNVAADNRPGAIEYWLFSTTMTHSVRRHAKEAPAAASDRPDAIKLGASQYHDMCTACHGAPGIAPDEIGKGLNPAAPDLSHAAARWSNRELFWIIKNGIRFTGMPAWGKTHSDEEIWRLANFVKHLPALNAEQYRSMVRREAKRLHGNDESHRH